MKRRTDRAIAVCALVAVAVVPTVIVLVVQAGGESARESGSAPASAMAQRDPASNPNGTATGVVTPAAPSAPGTRTGPAGTAGGAPGTAPGGRAGDAFSALPTAPPTPGPSLHAFTRKTEVKATHGSDGDYTHATETATFTVWPKFAMNATGVTRTMRGGRLTTLTQKVIVSGRTLKGFDGAEWSEARLTDAQLNALQSQSDPRQFTLLIGTLPGVTASGPDENGTTRFTAEARMGSVYPLLPREAADALRAWIPDGTGCGLDLRADGEARPTRIGLDARTPDAALTGSMAFTGYR